MMLTAEKMAEINAGNETKARVTGNCASVLRVAQCCGLTSESASVVPSGRSLIKRFSGASRPPLSSLHQGGVEYRLGTTSSSIVKTASPELNDSTVPRFSESLLWTHIISVRRSLTEVTVNSNPACQRPGLVQGARRPTALHPGSIKQS
jgi:hypothetical protein